MSILFLLLGFWISYFFIVGVVLLLLRLQLFRIGNDSIPGNVFAKDNQLKRPFLQNNSNYLFLYEEYKNILDSALFKESQVSWGLPSKEGMYGLVFLSNLDVVAWTRLSKEFPHLVIDATDNDRFLGNNIQKDSLPLEQVVLEGDFPKFFKVYTETGQQIITLQILSPDRMAVLIDSACYFDIEIKEDHLKIYGVNIQKSAETMKTFFTVLDSLSEDLKIAGIKKIKIA